MITESYNMPIEIKDECTKLTRCIASFFRSYFKRRIEHSKTKKNYTIIQQHKYYRLTTEYKKYKDDFIIKKSKVKSNWGLTDYFIQSKNNIYPGVYVKLTHGYSAPIDGYVDTRTNQMFLLLDISQFIIDFISCINELENTIYHETIHILQLQNPGHGLPKSSIMDKTRDIYGRSLINPNRARSSHIERDIEFKSNVHTYAYHIKEYLNTNYSRIDWKRGFIKLISNTGALYHKSDILMNILNELYLFKRKNINKWKIFIKEIYKEIFL